MSEAIFAAFFLWQVKELGAVLYNCSCLAQDLGRIFAMYTMLGGEGASIPAAWPASVAAESSLDHPLKLQLNGSSADLYLSVSPALVPLSLFPLSSRKFRGRSVSLQGKSPENMFV